MQFELGKSIKILERTPAVLEAYLLGLSDEWLKQNEGKDTWSPYDVVGHLIFGEKTDWMVRIKVILNGKGSKSFQPFDRFAQFQEDQSKPISELLQHFRELRFQNLNALKSLKITESDLALTGIHPEFGLVTLAQLIATWTVNDLGHIGQISRTMAKQYTEEVGPWINYLSILKK
ncbi:DinB family protein [Spongiimicrobium salis]|uniref:DinB family protein n=1 Tax=Spongiimicrobium salis TaxID=1667022 RepID=UPI00374CE62F